MGETNLTCAYCGGIKKRMYPTRSKHCLKCTWAVRHPLAPIAVKAVKSAIKAGLMPRPDLLNCIDCEGVATEYDHRNYNRPIDVDPVCRSCNHKRGPAHPYLCEDVI